MGKYSKEKVPELYAAKRALIAYLKEHNIDPYNTKIIDKDPKLKELVYKLNKERDKVLMNYPSLDKSNNIKLLKMAKENKKAKTVKVNEAEVSEKKKQGRTVTKYDYPQVKDPKTGKMRDMTKDEKKKYRAEQRKAAQGSKEKTSSPKAKDTAKEKKNKKAKDEKKPKPQKKAKKVKKEED